jgi:hypothetical protein
MVQEGPALRVARKVCAMAEGRKRFGKQPLVWAERVGLVLFLVMPGRGSLQTLFHDSQETGLEFVQISLSLSHQIVKTCKK